MILFIDSSGFDKQRFAIIDGKKVAQQVVKIKYPETEKTLGHLDKFLKSKRIKLDNISRIVVVTGAGSFTGIRVGVSISLAFSFAKNIPLYSVPAQKVPKKLAELATMKLKKAPIQFDPDYGSAPNITIKKPWQ